MKCPHCGHKSHRHDSQQLDRLKQSARYACSNLTCGHTFIVQTEAVYTLSPSATPDEALTLPICSDRLKPSLKTHPAGATPQDCHPDQLRLPEV